MNFLPGLFLSAYVAIMSAFGNIMPVRHYTFHNNSIDLAKYVRQPVHNGAMAYAEKPSTDKAKGSKATGVTSGKAVLSAKTTSSTVSTNGTVNQSSSQGTTSSSSSLSSNTAVTLTPRTITAHSTIHSNGKIIHLTMQYPNTGGAITGTLSGDCNGTLSGHYDGPSTELLSGTAKATCPMGFFSVPVTISYSGKLAPSATTASINYTVSAMGQKDGGSTTLTLQ